MDTKHTYTNIKLKRSLLYLVQPVQARASVAMRDSSSRAMTNFSSEVRELKSTPLVPSWGVPATGVPSLLLSSFTWEKFSDQVIFREQVNHLVHGLLASLLLGRFLLLRQTGFLVSRRHPRLLLRSSLPSYDLFTYKSDRILSMIKCYFVRSLTY